MHIALAAVFGFAVLTLWVPGYWPISVFQTGVFVLCGLVIWRERRCFPQPSFPSAVLGLAVLWGLLQWLTGCTVYAFETKRSIVFWSTLFAVFVIGFALFREAHILRWFRSAMLWFSLSVAVVATLQTFTSNGEVFWLFPSEYAHVMGPILSRNHYAAFIELVLPIALYETLRRERDVLLYAAIPAAMYASVLASASRAGVVLATAEIIVVVVLMRARGKTTGRALGRSTLSAVALIAVFGTVVGWQAVWNRLVAPDPAAGRREFAVSSLQMIKDHPWFGTGLGTWSTRYPRYAMSDTGLFINEAHSDWLQWTAEGGIPFGIMMASLLFWCVRPAFRTIWGLGVVAVFLHAGVDYPFSRPALASWPVLVIAMLAARGDRPAPADTKSACPAASAKDS